MYRFGPGEAGRNADAEQSQHERVFRFHYGKVLAFYGCDSGRHYAPPLFCARPRRIHARRTDAWVWEVYGLHPAAVVEQDVQKLRIHLQKASDI